MGMKGKNGAVCENEFTDTHNTPTHTHTHTNSRCGPVPLSYTHTHTGDVFLCDHTWPDCHVSRCAFSFPTAYQLRICQPPAPVVNANILADNEEFEIGLSRCFVVLVLLCQDQRSDCGILHHIHMGGNVWTIRKSRHKFNTTPQKI